MANIVQSWAKASHLNRQRQQSNQCHDITGNPSIRSVNEIMLSGHYDRSQPYRERYRTTLCNYAWSQLHREISMYNIDTPELRTHSWIGMLQLVQNRVMLYPLLPWWTWRHTYTHTQLYLVYFPLFSTASYIHMLRASSSSWSWKGQKGLYRQIKHKNDISWM